MHPQPMVLSEEEKKYYKKKIVAPFGVISDFEDEALMLAG